MSHTYTQNVVHIVFSTKDRRRTIPPNLQERLWPYMAGICKNLGAFLHAIGGTEDHVHLLIEIPAALSLSKAVQDIKTNSSRWVSGERQIFAWQKGYGAFSVSHSSASSVIRYIENQEKHHKKMTFDHEFVSLLKKHGMAFDPQYVFG